MTRAFVIRPFEKKKDSEGNEIDFEVVHGELIGPALQEAKLRGSTTGEIVDAGNIREDMFSLIASADVVICDITISNANIYYELGIRHALRKKRTVLIRGTPTADKTPFDLLTDRYLAYEIKQPKNSVPQLVAAIRASIDSERETDSPVFRMLPRLMEADPTVSQFMVPKTLQEAIDRAQKARGRGWLRLLAQELCGTPFEHPVMRMVAHAQWAVEDFDAARESWEAIRDPYPHDVDANLALANIYERIFRKTQQRSFLTDSDAAIQRVLGRPVERKDRAEALTLMGRNRKSEWRRTFEKEQDAAKRRTKALSRTLYDSYDCYRQAYLFDLNHYYPGLSALQAAVILKEFSASESWPDLFSTDEEADDAKTQVARDVESLSRMVPVSLEGAKLRGDDKNDPWFKITHADLLFLTTERQARVELAYKNAVEPTSPFTWNAARGQLELFESLGVRAKMARAVIDVIQASSGTFAAPAEVKPLQVIMFAGHRIDPKFGSSIFPEEEVAAERIRAGVKSLLKEGHRYEAYASASPGGDILFHEICSELGIESTLCLPMPFEDYSREAFGSLDDWRNRFLEIAKNAPQLILSDRNGLPSWLIGSCVEAWSRGNRWVLEISRGQDPAHLALLAFWDGSRGRGPGGTDHMVEIARADGTIQVEIVPPR